MATLHNKELNLRELKASDFCAEIPGAFICNVFWVEDEKLVVVEELNGNNVHTSLFDSASLEKISVKSRYEKYNNLELIERKFEYELYTLIVVNPEFGGEVLQEKVFLNGQMMYFEERVRYSRIATPSLWERYSEYLSLKNNERSSLLVDLSQYTKMSMNEKVAFLRGRFHDVHKQSYELGIPIECMFLSREEFVEYDKDADFRIALLEVLRLELHFSGGDIDDVFEKIVKHHGGQIAC
ncbi:hypothetical protein D0C16_22850 [Cellvibrio sp. KY-GH-1]|uniref:hypothetical protein n=1 Tax=Cellvibrio sp. KY-GH-1 TaxID=2303332 RepID=UPI001243C3AB|nr:hypothetical protein [Cellvibrio sp. KY-GH-1]QEY18570.1 hypothetical protein D0C16_22850 [Cellvibrio sp. KY-GH-1]